MKFVLKYLCSLEIKYEFFKHVAIKSVKHKSKAYRNSFIFTLVLCSVDDFQIMEL